jgi:protein-tyrosine kinase
VKKNKQVLSFNKKEIPYNFIWAKEKPLSFITESYQKIIANLEYVNVDKKYQVLQVSSSVSSEGKTTFLANLAYLLSKKGKKTILIDLDLRRPKVHKIYDVDNTKGITDILAERVELEDAIRNVKSNGFDVITSGEKTSAIINLIESNKMKQLVEKLRKKYDYILIDSPPVINVSDAIYISKLSDSIIFVLSQSKTKRGLVKDAIKLLKQNNCNILGIVLNQVDIKKDSYGYGYGYGYGYEYSYNTTDD